MDGAEEAMKSASEKEEEETIEVQAVNARQKMADQDESAYTYLQNHKWQFRKNDLQLFMTLV